MASKYGKKTQKKMDKVMHEFKEGKLKSGSGDKVTDRDQAIAIGLSEARAEGDKAPKKSASSHKKTSSAKSSSHKSGSKGRHKDTILEKTEKVMKSTGKKAVKAVEKEAGKIADTAKDAAKAVKKTATKAVKQVKKAMK